MNDFWGRPGGGAPLAKGNRKEHLDNMIHHSPRDPVSPYRHYKIKGCSFIMGSTSGDTLGTFYLEQGTMNRSFQFFNSII